MSSRGALGLQRGAGSVPAVARSQRRALNNIARIVEDGAAGAACWEGTRKRRRWGASEPSLPERCSAARGSPAWAEPSDRLREACGVGRFLAWFALGWEVQADGETTATSSTSTSALSVWLARVAGRERPSLRCKSPTGETADRTQALTMALTLSLTIRFADAKAAPFGLAKAHGGRDDGPRKSSDSNLLVPLRRRSTLSLRPRFDTPNACSVQAERSSQWRSSERDLPLSKRRSGVENET